MTDDDTRRLIAPCGTPDRPQAHLEPIVEAELAWGNRVLSKWGRSDKLLDDRSLTLTEPFHIELLRKTFRFPPNVRMWAILPRPGHRHDKPRLLLSDTDRYVTIHSPLSDDWPYGEGEVTL
jgi:hypothetical protein